MHIDKKRGGNMNRRKGLTWRPLLAAVWFVTCVICVYLVTGWLIGSQVIQADLIYASLDIAPELSAIVVRLTSTLLLVATLHYATLMFFATTKPASKTRQGRPRSVAKVSNYDERQYNRSV